jgi:hypothetical protein
LTLLYFASHPALFQRLSTPVHNFTIMPLITTPRGLRYYRFSDRTKRIWQYRLENGNWLRLPKPIRIAEGYEDQYTFGISHFSDPLKEPVVSSIPFPYSLTIRNL